MADQVEGRSMNQKYKTLAKDTVIFGLGRFGSRLILFFLVPLYTNVLTQAEYGTADLVFTVSQLLIPLFSVVIYNSVTRFGLARDARREDVLLNAFVVILGTITLSVAVTPLYSLYKGIAAWRWFLTLIIITAAVMDVEMNYLKVCGKNMTYSVISIIQAGVLAGSNILFLISFSMGVRGYLLATIASYLSTTVLAFICGHILRDLRSGKFDRDLLRQMLLYSAPLILNNISWWVIQSSDKLMLEGMINSAALGLYSAAAKIPSLINVVVSIFHLSWGISSIKEYESSNQYDFYATVFRVFSFCIFGCCLLLNTIVKPFMHFYVGEAFREAWHYTPLLVASAGFSAISIYFGTLYGALKKTKNNMITTIIGAVVNLVVNYLAILLVGIWGALIGTLVSYIVVAGLRMFDIHRRIPFDIDFFRVGLNSLLLVLHAVLVSIDFFIVPVSVCAIAMFAALNKSVLIRTYKMAMAKLHRRKS